MDRLLNDLRYGLRVLRRDPGFTLAAVLVLALGIGATTSIFTVVNAILLRPLPFPESERLVVLCEDHPRVAGFCVASPSNVRDWGENSETLAVLGVARGWPFHLRIGEERGGVAGGFAMGTFFKALGLRPALGRLFRADELGTLDPHGSGIGPGAPPVAVLSHELWLERFGAEANVIGRSIYIDEHPYTVVGVLPADTRIPELEHVRVWLPFPFDLSLADTRGWRGFIAIGRLAPAADLESLRSELQTLQARVARAHPEANEGWGVSAQPLIEHVVGDVRPTLLIFLGAVGLVLLIACFNVANLLLVRSARRDTEFAVRSSVGADRGQIARQIFTEGILLALIAGGLGTVLAIWATDLFVSLAPAGLPRVEEIGMDGTVLAFTLFVSIATCFLFGLGPLLRQNRLDLRTILQTGRPGLAGRLGGRTRRALVAAEIALAMMLLIAAGLLLRSFTSFLAWEPGFEQEHVLTVSAFASNSKYQTSAAVADLWRRAEDELASLPGVTAVASASAGPLFGGRETASFEIVGRPSPTADEAPTARWYDVSPGYFEAMGIPLVAGRGIHESEPQSGPAVALVNQAMARRHWPEESPVGERINLGMGDLTLEIVGVVRDVPPIVPGRPPEPEIYWSNRQLARWATFLVIRTAGDPSNLVGAARARLQQVDPDLDVGTFRTMHDLADHQLVRPRFNAVLVGSFALIALILASVGLYGVISYTISTRAHEIGIRIALGADAAKVIRTVLQEGAAIIAAGIIIGSAGAWAASGLLTSLLYGIEPTDSLTYAATAFVLTAIALLACSVPAVRASRIDPVRAMRIE